MLKNSLDVLEHSLDDIKILTQQCYKTKFYAGCIA